MGLIEDDFLECEECGHNEFIKQELFKFHKKIRARELEYQKGKELHHLSKRVTYVCAKCHHELNK